MRPAQPDEVLAGYAVALLALGAVAVATAVISPYGLVFVVPSLYAWLWLPQFEHRSDWVRDLLYGLGLAGPALAVVVVGTQLGLGLNTPLYLVSLMTLGFIPWTTILVLIAWAAVAAQLGALAAGRYRSVPRRHSGLRQSWRKRTELRPARLSAATARARSRRGRRPHDHVRLLPDDRVDHRAVRRSRSSAPGRSRPAPAAAAPRPR